jgi:hypothetical protein
VELDRDAAFPLELIVVEDLVAHLPRVERLCTLQETIGQSRLPMVDVRHDTKIAYAVGVQESSA